MNKQNNRIEYLGVPLDNLTMDEAIDRIMKLVEAYRKDLEPRYVSTVNSNFLSNVHHWNWGRVRNPELLNVLRNASISTIDGMPIVWCCRFLGAPVKERVSGSDLFPLLAEAMSKKKYSLFLLGGSEKTLKLCKLYLQALYPELMISGTANPKIDIDGENLESSEDRDSALVEQINRANPDVLLVNLGNPKQEIWFERVKPQLRVPVTMGVGGAFDLLTGMVPRAPVWMQKSGLEWLYRLVQEPKRLWKRYLVDIFKFSYMSLPLLAFHQLNRLIYAIFHRSSKKNPTTLRSSLLFISTHHTLVLVSLPLRINDLVTKEISNSLDDLFSQDALIFDFRKVKHIDLEGVALLLSICQRAIKEKKQLFYLNFNSDTRLLLQLHRVWDIVSHFACDSVQDISNRLLYSGKPADFYDCIQQEGQIVVISFFGKLDNTKDYGEYYKKLTPILYQKNCILDFSYCTYIDNEGFGFLLKLKNPQNKQFNSLSITGLSPSLREQFRNAKVLHLFNQISDLDDIFR
jgi:N-acetylglucosaminyldiphosphoundecaprenol N-acetyl-beta-D-mannosaminyltransferase